MDIYTLLLGVANVTPENAEAMDRDRIVVSHGHTSAGFYSALAAHGFFDPEEMYSNFRRTGSPYQGHVERDVPGVDWGTGNLGQGLAAGVGFALAARNLEGVDVLPSMGANVYDILRRDTLVITKAGVEALEARLGKGV